MIVWADFSGEMVGVLDGDTIEVMQGHQAQRVRLNVIDCLKNGQAYGSRAKQAASVLVFGKVVTVRTHGMDKYGRTIADVLLPDSVNVNHDFVKLTGALGSIAGMVIVCRWEENTLPDI